VGEDGDKAFFEASIGGFQESKGKGWPHVEVVLQVGKYGL